jgi:hypothetical protein
MLQRKPPGTSEAEMGHHCGREHERMRRRAWVLAAVALGVLLLAGCGDASGAGRVGTPTATPSAPRPGPGFALYKSPDGVYAVTYPMGWTSTPLDASPVVHGVAFASPDEHEYFYVLPLNQSLPTADYANFIQNFAEAKQATDISPAVGDEFTTSTTSSGAHSWTELDGGMTLGGTAYALREYGTPHGGGTALVLTAAPTAGAQQTLNSIFRPMLASLTFFK